MTEEDSNIVHVMLWLYTASWTLPTNSINLKNQDSIKGVFQERAAILFDQKARQQFGDDFVKKSLECPQDADDEKQSEVSDITAQFTKTKVDVEQGDDETIRSSWGPGSVCSIYSTSKKQWFQGKIIQIIKDDKGEWVRVQYSKSTTVSKTKRVRRDSPYIRPNVESTAFSPPASEQPKRMMHGFYPQPPPLMNQHQRRPHLRGQQKPEKFNIPPPPPPGPPRLSQHGLNMGRVSSMSLGCEPKLNCGSNQQFKWMNQQQHTSNDQQRGNLMHNHSNRASVNVQPMYKQHQVVSGSMGNQQMMSQTRCRSSALQQQLTRNRAGTVPRNYAQYSGKPLPSSPSNACKVTIKTSINDVPLISETRARYGSEVRAYEMEQVPSVNVGNGGCDVVHGTKTYEQAKLMMNDSNKEAHLTYHEFEKVFGMKKSAFYELKAWKQKSLKKQKGLF